LLAILGEQFASMLRFDNKGYSNELDVNLSL
jgi:hypothetical protein